MAPETTNIVFVLGRFLQCFENLLLRCVVELCASQKINKFSQDPYGSIAQTWMSAPEFRELDPVLIPSGQ